MQISISTRHGQLSEKTRAKVTDKLRRLDRFFDRVSSLELIIDLEHRDVPTVDLKVTVKQKELVASGRAEELIASIDQAIDKMEQQLRKYKEKAVDRHRNAGHRQEGPGSSNL